ncbi:MAG: hypothetical protein SF182_11390 [Deltaproteobacteria bacterium]|nr:hypothetical protein [Deltaproteobacteria bacterium]
MVARRMLRTTINVLALAFVFAAGVACFGLFGSSKDDAVPANCATLTGQAKIDCENQQQRK